MDIQELKLTLSDLNERLNDIKINVYQIDSKKTRLITKNNVHIDQALTLKRYEIRRKNMNLLMLKSMDFFVNLFGSKNLYIKLLRNFGLSGVNKTQFLKKFFINHAAGKNKL